MMMMMMMEQERAGSGDERGGETSRCQDCGNKAKKNCVYIRCRTCCKRKGFECETHIKSTWIPAYKRRQKHHSHHHQYHSNNHYNSIHHHHHHHHQEQQLLPIEEQEQNQRQQQLLLFQLQGGGGGGGGGGGNSGSSHNPKRLRDLNPHSSSGLEAGNFPGQTSSQATFRCVKVSSVDGAMESQYAYQTAVTIGGHLFKGILYDQGPVENCNYANVGESSSDDPPPPSSNMAAIGMTPSTTACGGNSADQTLLPPPYSFPFSPFMFGTQFFPHPKS